MKQEPAEELARTLEDWWSAMTVAFARIGAPAQATGGDDDDGDDREPLLGIALRSEGEREAVHYQIGGEFIALPLIPLLLTRTELDATRTASLTKAIVVRRGGDWRAWVARARMRGLPAAELQEATARAQALAPNETEVLRLTAAEAVREGRWADARTLGIRAWLGGAEDIEDRTILFVAAAQLGHCEEAARWTRSTAETKQMNAFLLRFQEERDLPKRACGVNDPDLK